MNVSNESVEYKQFFTLSPNLLYLAGFDGYFKEVNPAWEKTTGWTIEELLARPIIEFIHPDDRTATLAEGQKLMSGTDVISYENRYLCKDGAYKWILWSSWVSELIVAVGRDITGRKQTELALAQRAAQLILINDIGRQISNVLELDSLLESATRLVQERFDYHHAALFLVEGRVLKLKAVAGSYTTYFPTDHTQQLSEGINGWVASHGQKIVANDVSAEPRYTSLIAEHTITRAELCLPLIIAQEVVGVLDIQSPQLNAFSENDVVAMEALCSQLAAAIHNVRLHEAARQSSQALEQERNSLAERVEARTAELKAANAELARATRLKDEFLANMSHELRTPLNAILGMTEVLQLNIYGALNPEQLNAVKHVDEAGRHLLALINDILDLSKIEANRLSLEITQVTIEDVCQASLAFIKQLAQTKQIKYFLTLDNTVDIIQADARRLKQILINLLTNAVKFTPEEGQVGLEVVSDSTQGMIHFTVWDTGIGISPEDVPRLFKPFVQLDSSLSRQYQGTGLGLSLVSRLAKMHGGEVSVESNVGQGSRFTVSLPMQVQRPNSCLETEFKSKARPGTNGSSPPVAGGAQAVNQAFELPAVKETASRLVLLAEDSKSNIILVRDFLRVRGYQVEVARNGLEAINLAGDLHPDIMLIDIHMPEMDGLEAIRRIRADARLQTMPIIALTALAMPGDREKCLEAGANDYLSKPARLPDIIKAIEDQLKPASKTPILG